MDVVSPNVRNGSGSIYYNFGHVSRPPVHPELHFCLCSNGWRACNFHKNHDH